MWCAKHYGDKTFFEVWIWIFTPINFTRDFGSAVEARAVAVYVYDSSFTVHAWEIWNSYYRKVLNSRPVYCSQLCGTWISEEYCHGTGKRIQDRSIISSIEPKFDDQFFGDLRVLFKLGSWNYFTSSTFKIKDNFMFTTCTKHVNQQSISCQILN